jgi:hypothetical protein
VRAGAVSGKRIYDKTDFIHGRYLRLKESADYGIEGFSIIQRGFEMKNLLISYPAYSREFFQPQNGTDFHRRKTGRTENAF